MASPEIPPPVKFITAVTFQNEGMVTAVEAFLEEVFGAIDLRSEVFAFDFTDYYAEEMGTDLRKIFVSFADLAPREGLPQFKLHTNGFESETAENGRRTVNIDPGYLGEANLVLATAKNFSHEIYLGDGIFGDCHLLYQEGAFHPLPWTYPDYREAHVLEFFARVREEYYRQLREGRIGNAPPVTYRDAGVDIDAGDRAVDSIKQLVRRTYGKNVVTGLGQFGGFYAPDWKDYTDPVLVSSVDGVGTKLKVAFAAGVHGTIGRDLVNHCINDILCCGAKPLFFLDYLAFGKLEPDIFEAVVAGMASACEDAGCALIGGETAEMPGLYRPGEYDVSGTVVGIVERRGILDGSAVSAGDIVIGLPSSGLHTNGYSLARRVLFDKAGLSVHSRVPELETTVGEELLKVHRCYYPELLGLIEKHRVHGLAHITGGGLVGNISRLLRAGLSVEIDWDSWKWPPVFKLIRERGNIPDDEMRRVFNLGIGLAVIAPGDMVQDIHDSLEKNHLGGMTIGRIVGAAP